MLAVTCAVVALLVMLFLVLAFAPEARSATPDAPAPLLVRAKARPDSPWKEYPTRTIERLAGFTPGAAAVPLTRYGGRTDRKADATGFFHVRRVKDRWWLVDPEGGFFLHVGVCSVSPGKSASNRAALQAKFGGEKAWAEAAARLLGENGFNGTGAWGDPLLLRQTSRPAVYTLIWNFMSTFGRQRGLVTQKPGHAGYPNDCIPVFHPEFEAFCDTHARALAATKDDPWLLGHFSDNEMPCPRDLLDKCLALDAADPHMGPNRRAAEAWLRERRGDGSPEKTALADADREAFRAHVFERYYDLTTRAIRKVDPNHLCLGSRLYGSEKASAAVLGAAGRHLDAVAVNYYGAWTPDARTLANWTAWSGRPVLITEWYTKGGDAGLANSTGAGWIVPTQADRGLFYQNYTLALVESGTCVGWHWFKYMDNDPADLSAEPSNRDSNKGIVTIRFEPYAPLLDRMRALNREVYALADYFDARAGRGP